MRRGFSHGRCGDDRERVVLGQSLAESAPPALPSYPIDQQWRVAARFDQFNPPRQLRVPDVRGGALEYTAVGQLVFRLNGEDMRLTAIGVDGARLAVLNVYLTRGRVRKNVEPLPGSLSTQIRPPWRWTIPRAM
jgi:hypothetical protein